MNRRELLSELRRLFAEEQKVQWRIGDILCREVGPPGNDHANTGALQDIEEIANSLGVSLATLLKYRRMAATYPDDIRVSSVSFTAHEAASAALDPPKVIAEAQQAAEREADRRSKETGRAIKPQVTVGLVREIASQPKHQDPRTRLRGAAELRQTPGAWGLELDAVLSLTSSHLRRILTMLQAVGPDEELKPVTQRRLLSACDHWDGQISWIRGYLRGEHVADEIAEFLQEQV